METSDPLDELLTCRLNLGRKQVEPCTVVIFGASGDLTARKLVPALYHLHPAKQLLSPVRIVGSGPWQGAAGVARPFRCLPRSATNATFAP